MRISQVEIKNFRLLADVELVLEDQTTVIVGRNNSGKTSLSEVMRRLLSDGNVAFQLEDFSSACYDHFCEALQASCPCVPFVRPYSEWCRLEDRASFHTCRQCSRFLSYELCRT